MAGPIAQEQAAAGALWRARALVTAVDLAWVLPVLWLAAALTGRDVGAAVVFAALQPVGLFLGIGLRRVTLPPPAMLIAHTALAAGALVLALWAGLYSGWPFFDPEWLGEALRGLADSPYRLGPEALLLPAGALLLWRGGWLAANRPQHRTAGASFQAGIVALALVAAIGGEERAVAVLAWALSFLAVGLLALSVARGDEAGARRDAAARFWALGFTAVLLATAFALALSGGDVARALAALGWQLLEAVLGAVDAFFTWLASLAGPPQPASLPPEAVAIEQARRSQLRELLTVPEPVRRVGGMLVMVGFVVPLVVAVARYLGELWRRFADPLFMAGVRVEAFQGTGWGVGQALRDLFFRLGRLLWRGTGGRGLDGDPRGWPVRAAYRDLLARAARRGEPRPPAATAAEHLAALCRAYPGHDADLAAVTGAYERARYGPSPAREEVVAVRARLRRMTRHKWFGR